MSWRNELYVGQLHTERLWIGTSNGGVGSELSGTELGYLDGVIAGTAAASKALVLNSSSAITSGISAFTVDTSFYLGIDDTAYGRLYVYGGPAGAPQGGFIRLYTAADYDADDGFFSMNTTSALMWIGAENNLDMMIFYGVAAANGAYADSIRTTVNFDADNGFSLGGTAVTATAAELNYLDLTALGTGEGSKAVVLDAGEDFTWPATGVLTYGGTGITATGAEINYLDITTLGTGEASKAVTLDANADFVAPAGTAAGWDFVTNSAIVNLKVGAWEIEGVTVTSTAAELNILDNVTATAAELNYLDITAPGTGEASKALVLDATLDISGINDLGIDGDLSVGGGLLGIGAETVVGTVTCYGAATPSFQGGSLVLHTADDHDTTYTQYTMEATSANFALKDNTSNVFVVTGGGQIAFERSIYTDQPVEFAGTVTKDGDTIYSSGSYIDTFYLTIHIPDISTNVYAAVVVPRDANFINVESVLWGTIATDDDTLTFTTSSGAVTNVLVIANSGSNAGDIDTMTPGDNQACAGGSIISVSNTAASSNSVPVTLTIWMQQVS